MENIVTLSIDECKALGDPIRAAIVNILYHKTLTIEDIVKELAIYNHKKSVTAIRHHVEILKKCGLVEIAYTKEKRGTLEKYYKGKVKFLGFNEVSIELNDTIVSDLSKRILKIIDVIKKHLNQYEDKKCMYCSINHTQEYVISSIINKVLAKVLEEYHV